MMKFEETLRAIGGEDGIASAMLQGNRAPLRLVLQAARDEIETRQRIIRGAVGTCPSGNPHEPGDAFNRLWCMNCGAELRPGRTHHFF